MINGKAFTWFSILAHSLNIATRGVLDELTLRYLGLRWDQKDATWPDLPVLKRENTLIWVPSFSQFGAKTRCAPELRETDPFAQKNRELSLAMSECRLECLDPFPRKDPRTTITISCENSKTKRQVTYVSVQF